MSRTLALMHSYHNFLNCGTVSRGWGRAGFSHAMVELSMSVAVSDVAQNKAVLTMYFMGRKRWNQMIWVLDRCLFGVRKDREGMSSILLHRRMYASEKSTLLRYTGPRAGSSSSTHPYGSC